MQLAQAANTAEWDGITGRGRSAAQQGYAVPLLGEQIEGKTTC
jgi:hypothetical protein